MRNILKILFIKIGNINGDSMTESKRYQLRQEDLDYPIYSDLVDTEDNDRVICTFNNDSGTNKMVILLNEQNQRIKELESELELYKHHVEFIPSSEW